ncbi:MAG: peptidyl-prolyl cis-trans isomerase [Holophagaceae bacterium]|nr:peptidyl-prolyl cis-trans isomerase [Holophagaceae bacterium]
MLRNFRKAFQGNQTPTAILMMLTLVGMVAYLAPSGNPEARDNVVARAYGREILKGDWDLNTLYIQRGMGEKARTDEGLAYAQSTALKMLIDKAIKEEQAERHHVVVTDQEVREDLISTLKRYEFFKNPDGTLRPLPEIDRILQASQTSLKEFEKQSKERLIQQKLNSQLSHEMPVDEAWINLEHRARNEKISIEAVSLQPDPAAVADPGDAKLESYLQESGPRFQQGPRRLIQFVSVDMASFGNTLNPDEAALKAAYESKKAEYSELKASHILFKAKTDEEFAAATEKAQKLREELAKGADFSKKAETLSEDPSAKDANGNKGNKGDLGWFKSGQMVKSFEDAAVALKEGEFSQPVRTNFGIHIIRLDGRRTKSFEDVKETLRSELAQERFSNRAKEKLAQLRKRTGERGDLNAAARALDLQVKTSKPFLNEPSAQIEGIAFAGMMVNEVFRLKVGDISKVQSAGGAFVVFKVLSELPSSVPPLKEIRAKVLDSWKSGEAKRLLLETAAAQLKGGDLKALGEVKSSPDTTVRAYPEAASIGIRKELLATAAGQISAPVWGNDGKLWIGKVTARTPAPEMNFAQRRALLDELQKQLVAKQLDHEVQFLETEGRLRPGFSSLWGRVNGIWINPKATPAEQSDLGE